MQQCVCVRVRVCPCPQGHKSSGSAVHVNTADISLTPHVLVYLFLFCLGDGLTQGWL